MDGKTNKNKRFKSVIQRTERNIKAIYELKIKKKRSKI